MGEFIEKQVRPRGPYIFGVSVLICAIEPGTNKLFYLLGKERVDGSWEGSGKWGAFGGARNNREGIELAAIREFCEETCCTLMTPQEARMVFLGKKYEFSDDYLFHKKRGFRTYVIRVPFDVTLPERFRRTLAFLEFLSCDKREVLEKTELRWFPHETLVKSLNDDDTFRIVFLYSFGHLLCKMTELMETKWKLD